MAVKWLEPGADVVTPDTEEGKRDRRFVLPVATDESLDREAEELYKKVQPGITEYSGIKFGPPTMGAIAADAQAPTSSGNIKWLEPEPLPEPESEPEEPGIWATIIDKVSRNVFQQLGGGQREFRQRRAIQSATDTGEELRRLRETPEGETTWFGPASLEDMLFRPWKTLNFPEQIVKMAASTTSEGREALEAKLLEEMQEKLDKAKRLGEEAEARPFSPATQQFLNSESENTAWEDFMADPVTIIGELGMRSLPNMTEGILLGMAGGAAAGLPGFAAGMGAGSARVEYAATILGELQKQNVDIYNAEELMTVLMDTELMDEIHQKALTRAKSIGSFDFAAGALGGTQLVRKLGGPTVSRLLEAGAQTGSQGLLGGLGEALAMEQTGEAETILEGLTSREGLAEMAGEAVTAPVEVTAASVAGVREKRAGSLAELATEIDEETGKVKLVEEEETEVSPEVQAETEAPAFDVPPEGFSEAEREALETALEPDAEPVQEELPLAGQEIETPPSEVEQTTTTEPSPDQKASATQKEEPAEVTEEVVTADDLVTQPEPVSEPEVVEETSPMFDKKELQQQFQELNTKTEEGMPGIRKAVRELGTSINAIFPEVELPSLKGTIGAKRMSEYFTTLQEEVVLEDVLPDLKTTLEAVLESPDAATAVQNFNRLRDYIDNSGAGVIEEGAKTPFLEQVTKGITAYDTFEATRKQKRAQQTELAERAVAVDELATIVTALTEKALELGIEVPAEVNETVRRARSYRESSQVAQPRTLKGGAGPTVTPQKFNAKNLNEVGGGLRAAAQTLTEQIAEVGVKQPKKPKPKVKAKPRSAVTEAPAKPKKVEKAKKVPKAKAEKKAAPEKPAKKEVKVTRKGKPKKVEKVKPAPVADPDEVIVDTSAPAMTGKQADQFGEAMGVETGQGVSDRALEAAGVSKNTAKLLRGIMKQTDQTGRKKIVKALAEYEGDKDRANFIAAVYDAVGGKLQDTQMQELMEFAENKAAKEALDPNREISVTDEALAEEAAAQGMSLEDYKTILEDTGQYSEEQAEAESPWSDEFHDMSVDEFENSQFGVNPPRGTTKPVKNTGILAYLDKFTKRRGMPDPGPTNINAVLDAVIRALPRNNRFTTLARRLRQLNLDVPVYVYDEPVKVAGKESGGSYYPGPFYDPAGRKIRLYNTGDENQAFHWALHEAVHAATVAAYESDPVFSAEIESILEKAREVYAQTILGPESKGENFTAEILPSEFYGLVDAKEFIAEALTNPKFQTFLANAKSGEIATKYKLPSYVSGLMRKFINTIKKHLGYSVRNSLLEDVVMLVDTVGLQTEEEVIAASAEIRKDRLVSEEIAEQAVTLPPSKVSARNDILDANKRLKSNIKEKAEVSENIAKKAANKLNLGFSNLDVMERNYRSLFDKAGKAMNMANPLTIYTKAKNSAASLARKYEYQAYQLLKKLQKVDNAARSKMQVIMRDVTSANIDPTQPLNSPANAHIWTKGGKKKKPQIQKKYKEKAQRARQNWINFEKANPKAAKLVAEMAALTKQIHETKVKSALFALAEAYELDNNLVKRIQAAKTSADVDAIISPNEVEVINKQIETSDPKQAKVLKDVLSQAETRAEVAKSAKRIIYESSIKGWYFPLRRYGDYVVSTDPDITGEGRYVSFHATQAEAERVRDALNKHYPDNPVRVSLKLEKASSSADVKSVVGDLQRRFRGDGMKPIRDRLKGALVEVLAANAMYQSQITRHGVDGVAANDMARGFEEYVSVSKYSIGDLLVSHKIADAIKGMNTLQAEAESIPGVDTDEGILIGRVVNEIKLRNISDSNDRKMSPVQRTVGLVGFFNYLGAPSYWALNATQTYTVTVPYLAAKYGIGAPARLVAAQGTVLAAVGKALVSKDKSYEGFKAQLPSEAREIVEALEAENVIQSTIAHEFGDMLSPTALNKMREHALGAPVAKTTELALQIMEKVPEAVEHYNRISTALAAYEMSKNDITATIDAVQATQFNYDSGNRARLLKEAPQALGGGFRAAITPIMMFKTYGIGLMRLLYGAIFDVIFTKGSRGEAAKLAAGLITSHTLFGGAAGGLMAAPVMMIQALMNEMFREEGDEWDLEDALEEWAKEIGGDTFATAVKRGVPAALGVDMSRSVNLGNLMWMSDERIDYSEYGDIEKLIVRNIGGPIVTYGVNAWRAGARLADNEFRDGWAEFAEAAVPVKAYRGVSQAVRYNTEGIVTRGELELLKPEEFTQVIQTALGFQATQKTEIQDRYYSEQARRERRATRKSQLLKFIDQAIRDNNNERLAKVMQDVESFNESLAKYPGDRRYRITPADRIKLQSRKRSAQREYDKWRLYSD